MYRVDVANSGDYLFKVKSQNYEFAIDIKGKGITPSDTLLASLGSCVGVYIRKFAEGTNLALKDFSISVEGELCKETPIRFKEIDVSVDLRGVQIEEGKKKAFLEFIKNCPIHNTLKQTPHIEVNVI